MTRLGQLTPTDQRHMTYRMTSCLSVRLEGWRLVGAALIRGWLGIVHLVVSNCILLHGLFLLGFVFVSVFILFTSFL